MLRSPDYDDARLAALLDRAKERSRVLRRRQRLRRGLGVAVAFVLVAGLAGGVTALTHGRGGGQQIETAADVTRVEHALAPRRQRNIIGYTRTVYPSGTVLAPNGTPRAGSGPGSPWSVGSSVTWTYRGHLAISAFTAAGQPVFAEWNALPLGGTQSIVTVIYRNATWWRATAPAPGPPGGPAPPCPPPVTPGLLIVSGWQSYISHELSCGRYAAGGTKRVDGVDTVKLTGGRVSLWFNPATYLPVRLVVGFGRGQMRADFRWLSATRANLAQFHARIPAGFRRVPPPA